MTTEQLVECFLACLAGNLIHLLYKFSDLKKSYLLNKREYTFKQYWSEDRVAILKDFAGSMVLVWLGDEWLGDLGNYAINKIKTIYVLVGIGGSYVIMKAFSTSQKRFRVFLGEKADEHEQLKQEIKTIKNE